MISRSFVEIQIHPYVWSRWLKLLYICRFYICRWTSIIMHYRQNHTFPSCIQASETRIFLRLERTTNMLSLYISLTSRHRQQSNSSMWWTIINQEISMTTAKIQGIFSLSAELSKRKILHACFSLDLISEQSIPYYKRRPLVSMSAESVGLSDPCAHI